MSMEGRWKAIDTMYNGRRYRSRLEARWAVFFDRAWIQFDYEPEGYRLPSGPYLPDFFLPIPEYEDLAKRYPGAGFWVEVKAAGKASPAVLEQAAELAAATGNSVFVVAGNPWPGEFEIWKVKARDGRLEHCPAAVFTTGPLLHSEWIGLTREVPWDTWQEERLEEAFLAARSARFEHGETPDADFSPVGSVMDVLRRGPRIGRALRRGEVQRRSRGRIEGTEPA